MTLWELACYFAVFLGGVAGGWITCAVFTAARVNELGSECAQLAQKLAMLRATRIQLTASDLWPGLDERHVLFDSSVGTIEALQKRGVLKSLPPVQQESNPSA